MPPLLPNAGQALEQTADVVAPHIIQSLIQGLRQAQDESPHGRLTPEAIDAVATSCKQPRVYAWIALGMDPNLVQDLQGDILLAICVGQCQQQGAATNLATLLEQRDQRLEAQKQAFQIVPRQCLDMCTHAPVSLSRSPDGMAAHPKLTPEQIPEIIAALCD